MSDCSEPPRNRKERRAAARSNNTPIASPTHTPKIKMTQPDRSAPQTKTLLDLYDEKKSLLDQGQPFSPTHSDGLVRDEGGNILEAGLGDDEPIGPIGQAVFWGTCLAMLHFTLDVLIFNQYRQSIVWGEIFGRTATILPVLYFVVWLLRTETAYALGVSRQAFFFVLAVAAGCYTIYVGNTYDYYAVMKRAPPVGTLWVWSVIELDLVGAALSVAVNVGYLWWKGYGAF